MSTFFNNLWTAVKAKLTNKPVVSKIEPLTEFDETQRRVQETTAALREAAKDLRLTKIDLQSVEQMIRLMEDSRIELKTRVDTAELTLAEAARQLCESKAELATVQEIIAEMEANRQALRQRLETAEATHTAMEETVGQFTAMFECRICLNAFRVVIFGCGHGTCASCSRRLTDCPFCRITIRKRIKMFNP